MSNLKSKLWRETDIASLAMLRVFIGLVMFVSTVRFLANGWVERFFEKPTFFFSYWGFEFVEVASPEVLTLMHIVMAFAALGVTLGLFYRVSAVTFFVLFSYVELLDVTNYLNHYVLVSFLALLFCFLPLHGAMSLDAHRNSKLRRATVPAWMLYLLRVQIGAVYFYAGVAKLHPDWLLHGQPLGIWLAARAETPLIGPLLTLPGAALALSWAGLLHDLLIVPALLWKRTRKLAFVVLLVFHFGTHLLFTIGIFPILMPLCATIFFDPSWPREIATWRRSMRDTRSRFPSVTWRSFRRLPNLFSALRSDRIRVPPSPASTAPRGAMLNLGLVAAILWSSLQVLMPLRTYLYDHDVLWAEQGMRFSWRVMLREKNGSIAYRVRADGLTREKHVSPSKYLTSHQEREMSGQPDLILQLAHHIGREFEARGYQSVQVRVDARVSLNGRPARSMIDPSADLMQIHDGLGKASWIMPAPYEPPLQSHRITLAALEWRR